MSKDSLCQSIEVASRGNPKNSDFFSGKRFPEIHTTTVDKKFKYDIDGRLFFENTSPSKTDQFDIIFLRIDRPVSNEFLSFLTNHFPEKNIINTPSGIKVTGSKDFLINFPELCPPLKLCHTVQDVVKFSRQFPIVLKPLHNYGGKGIVKVVGDYVWDKNTRISFAEYKPVLAKHFHDTGSYLAMKYLKNVDQGDKRVIVVNGEIMGATLRLPKKGSWVCNISMGGSSRFAEPDQQEVKIANTISPKLTEKGVVIYGFDTLVDDDNRRVLSEINTLNVGGLLQAEMHSGQPVIKKSSDLIWTYISENIDIIK
ncbi:ATP-grasp domain-containing protein [Sodalinema gerasimenkoae]|uniref:ATP-grasp domain-containing protein n=1 Tax=Sodalinema gerasimenkoae TaxID=2862348 RepID=UPI00135A4D59|nr:hypothetical protein [Sodalinema gerasimenkoae]